MKRIRDDKNWNETATINGNFTKILYLNKKDLKNLLSMDSRKRNLVADADQEEILFEDSIKKQARKSTRRKKVPITVVSHLQDIFTDNIDVTSQLFKNCEF